MPKFSELKNGTEFRIIDPDFDMLEDDARLKQTFIKRNDNPFCDPRGLLAIDAVDTMVYPARLNYLGETLANAEWGPGENAGSGTSVELVLEVEVVKEGDGVDLTPQMPKAVQFGKVRVGGTFCLLDGAPGRVFTRLNNQAHIDADESFFANTHPDAYALTEKGRAAANSKQLSGPKSLEYQSDDAAFASLDLDRMVVPVEVQ